MQMILVDELRRRIESLESNHSGIGSEVAVVKAEVGAIHRDINFLRASAETMGNKMDTVIAAITAIQANNALHRPRDVFDTAKSIVSVIVGILVTIGMFVGAVAYVSTHNTEKAAAMDKAAIERLIQEQVKKR